VSKLFIFVGTTIGSYAGWALGDWVGFEMLGCFILSGILSIVGVYAGWKFAQKLTD
jgi:hypothetical protein